MLSEDSELTRPVLEPGSDSSERGDLVCSFNPSHLKVMGILYAHFLLKEKEKRGLGDPARSQPQGRGGSPRLNTGVADAASGAPRLLMLEPAVSVTVLALVFT